MDTLDGVSTFVAVAQCGSFSAAAQRLGCSKSTVSEQLLRLEKRIGARLLQRSSRAATLTEAGRAYLCQIDDVLDRVKSAEKAAQAKATEISGPLRISAPWPFARTHLAPLLPQFSARYPDIAVDVQVTAEVVDLVAAGYDLAIRLCPSNDPNTIVRKLGGTRLIAVGAPMLFGDESIPTEPEHVSAWPCLANSNHPRPAEWRFRRDQDERQIALKPRLVTNSPDLLRELALSGAGIAMLTEYAVIDDLKAGRLIRLFPDWRVADVPVLAVYPDNRQIATKVKAFVDFIARRLEPAQLVERPLA